MERLLGGAHDLERRDDVLADAGRAAGADARSACGPVPDAHSTAVPTGARSLTVASIARRLDRTQHDAPALDEGERGAGQVTCEPGSDLRRQARPPRAQTESTCLLFAADAPYGFPT